MKVTHLTGIEPSESQTVGSVGGLHRFIEELVNAQKSHLSAEILPFPADTKIVPSGNVVPLDWNAVADVGRALIGAANADIFHAHDWYGAVALEHLYRCGHRALVMTVHLPIRRGFTYRDTGLHWQVKALLEHRALQLATRVTAPSEYVMRFLIEEYGLPPNRIAVVPHGVNCETFYPLGKHKLNGPPRVLAVGRLTEQKGFELLVRAFPVILADEPGASLTIVGDGGRRSTLERLIVRLRLEKVVTLVGTASKRQLLEHFDYASLVVMPSQFEPFGLVGLEAMACGCPVLAVAPTGATEYLEDWEVSTAYSPPRLGRAIIEHLRRLRAGTVSRSAVRSRAEAWTWNRAVTAYKNIYDELV